MGRTLLVIALATASGACLIDIDETLLDGAVAPPLGDGGARADAGPRPTGCAGDTVRVPTGGASCVDATEVSRAAYADFLAHRSEAAAQPSQCRWNSDYTPEADWPPAAGTESRPVAAVDWCDALAYCRWRGQRLCGRVGGGAAPLAEAADPATQEWPAACTAAGTRAFPYGNAYSAGACRAGATSTRDVGAQATCEGGYPGLRDLSGNVEEWVDACDDGQGASGNNDDCAALGGGFAASESGLSCASATSHRRSSTAADRGFRCCATP